MGDFTYVWQTLNRLRGGFVLAFHEIGPARLAEFVDGLRPFQPVPLSEMVERRQHNRRTAGLFAITVDDGIGEVVTSLSDVCVRNSWPATFYLPTDYIDTGEGMPFQWWRIIQPYLPQQRLKLAYSVLDLSGPDDAQKLAKRMEQLWHTRPQDWYMPLTRELAKLVLPEQGSPRPAAPVAWEEVERLSRTGLIEFGSHGVSHTAMSALRPDRLDFEMRESRERISAHTGRPCLHLAYPFGNRASINNAVVAIARTFYDSATTMELGGVDGADPWRLPRIPLYPENSLAMARLKVLLKCPLAMPFNAKQNAPQVLPVEQAASTARVSAPVSTREVV